eukprot:4873491-Pleurochrysis_carterae.AAC.1
MQRMFPKWPKTTGYDNQEQKGKGKGGKEGGRENTYGIRHWGRVKSIPKIQIQVQNFLQKGIG